MTRTKTIKVLAFAKFQALLLAWVGFVAGTLYAVGGAIYDVLTAGSVNAGTALAFLAVAGMPVMFAIAGGIVGILEAVLYNSFAEWFGGVEIDFIN